MESNFASVLFLHSPMLRTMYKSIGQHTCSVMLLQMVRVRLLFALEMKIV